MRSSFMRYFGPQFQRANAKLPGNTPLPLALRGYADAGFDRPSDPLGRDAHLANLEALLFAADEPLPARRLAQLAGLADVPAAPAASEIARALR